MAGFLFVNYENVDTFYVRFKMTLQFCPSCGDKGFTWAIDEEVSPNTYWNCSLCSYFAEEKESHESVCENCNTKNNMYLKSEDEYFRYCTNCQSKSEADPWD